jgi:hypothetical protein
MSWRSVIPLLTSFTITDGTGISITNTDTYGATVFDMETGPSGNITGWSIGVLTCDPYDPTCTAFVSTPDVFGVSSICSPPACGTHFVYTDSSGVSVTPPPDCSEYGTCTTATVGDGYSWNPGVWSTPAPPTPEPSSMFLFGTGLLFLARRLRRTSH